LPAEESAEPYREPVSEPRLERLALRITGDLLVASGDPQAIASIHNRQSLSNDLQQIAKNILSGLFVIAGALIIVFGSQNKYTSLLMGLVLLVLAAGTSGFTTLSFKGFGMRAILGQSQPNGTTTPHIWQRAILWVLLGAVIGGSAVYASRYVAWFG
jgi:hypothetical protein